VILEHVGRAQDRFERRAIGSLEITQSHGRSRVVRRR
jgi:hypothetical protein